MAEMQVRIQKQSIEDEACKWLKRQFEVLGNSNFESKATALKQKAEEAGAHYFEADFAIADGTRKMFGAKAAYEAALRDLAIHYAQKECT